MLRCLFLGRYATPGRIRGHSQSPARASESSMTPTLCMPSVAAAGVDSSGVPPPDEGPLSVTFSSRHNLHRVALSLL